MDNCAPDIAESSPLLAVRPRTLSPVTLISAFQFSAFPRFSSRPCQDLLTDPHFYPAKIADDTNGEPKAERLEFNDTKSAKRYVKSEDLTSISSYLSIVISAFLSCRLLAKAFAVALALILHVLRYGG